MGYDLHSHSKLWGTGPPFQTGHGVVGDHQAYNKPGWTSQPGHTIDYEILHCVQDDSPFFFSASGSRATPTIDVIIHFSNTIFPTAEYSPASRR
ncbi:hypothetical protein KJ564_14410 [bacterium]|nr:hypothetical protein [bacterium]